MQNLPESEIPDVREYLYIDAQRVRNLLAQVQAGAPENISESTQRSRKLAASFAKIVGLSAEMTGSSERQESRSLNDLHVTMLEESALAMGVLSDVSVAASKRKNWLRGKLHSKLGEGSLIRLEADTRIIDSKNFTDAFSSFSDAMGEGGDDEANEMNDLVKALYGDHVAIRCYPCGVENSSCCFSGIVPGESSYFSSERSTLFSRVGPDAQRWTSLLQVARIPERSPGSRRDFSQVMDQMRGFTDAGNDLNRHTFDSFLMEVMREFESSGLQESHRFPEISVVPLAVYRQVMPVDDLADLEEDDEDEQE